ncbi:DUF3135 domain-containing protein [Shewanella khirikhana]|uniref:DUF3135 domain-containing protein n=1 Tax=Shewanella khirikhana TaxID=1965282 RepID=UPI0030D2979A
MTPLPDFDTLLWMADNQPDELERLRSMLNREVIEESECNKAQLECLVFNLDRQLERCSNPYHRCVVAMSMMRGKLHTLQNLINEPNYLERTSADVIPLFKA